MLGITLLNRAKTKARSPFPRPETRDTYTDFLELLCNLVHYDGMRRVGKLGRQSHGEPGQSGPGDEDADPAARSRVVFHFLVISVDC